MRGRFRELCQGINVDMGTAAAFREQWLREAAPKKQERVNARADQTHLILKTDQMPGDAVAMTAAIYSLHHAHPDKYLTAVDSFFPDVFAHNPHVVPVSSLSSPKPLHMHYPAIHRCNERGIHFMQGWCEFLGSALGISVPLLTNRPHIYFIDEQPRTEDFWVICSGGKRDFTNKLWGHANYQKVVDALHGRIRFIQVGSGKDDHPPLTRTENMVGKTTLRQLFDLVRRARGVVCGVSLLMHVAAALEKPAVIIAGGREPVQWNAYAKQQYVHTIGALPCRSTQGHIGYACWRARVLPLGDGTGYDKDTCERPISGLPLCMRMISPEHVAELVLRYDYVNSVR